MKTIQNIPKLRFKEFSEEWEIISLKNICQMTSSKRVYLSDYSDKGIPFYRGKEITELKENKTPSEILYITKKNIMNLKKNMVCQKKMTYL